MPMRCNRCKRTVYHEEDLRAVGYQNTVFYRDGLPHCFWCYKELKEQEDDE